MILGKLKHRVFDIFNKNEQIIVSNINKKLTKKDIIEIYNKDLKKIINEIFNFNSNLAEKFNITLEEFSFPLVEFMQKEIELRAESILKTIEKGFLGKELWKNLSPKYITELWLSSENLGLKGRIDRIKIQGNLILPYELKTRQEIFDSDMLQLSGYSLLLEDEFNVKVDKGVVESAKSKQSVNITNGLKNKFLKIAEEIRNLKNIPQIPNNFNKCKLCRLKDECLEIED